MSKIWGVSPFHSTGLPHLLGELQRVVLASIDPFLGALAQPTVLLEDELSLQQPFLLLREPQLQL